MEDSNRKRITPALLSRSVKHAHEFNNFMCKLYNKDVGEERRAKFLIKYGEEFPILTRPHVYIRIGAKLVFNKYFYSLRDQYFAQEPLPKDCPRDFAN